jgi:hypothetical protein
LSVPFLFAAIAIAVWVVIWMATRRWQRKDYS